MSNFNLKVNLLRLEGAFVTGIKGKTGLVPCLIVPVEKAHLFNGEKGVYLDLAAFEMKEARYNDTHVIKQSLPREVLDAMTDEQRRALPIIGQMRPKVSEAKPMAVDTVLPADAVENADDLPF